MTGRIWSDAEIGGLVKALQVELTENVARRFNLNPKSIRGLLLRRGLKLRQLRRPPPSERALGGLVARRSIASPPAFFGAEALARLPDRRCSWPMGIHLSRASPFAARLSRAAALIAKLITRGLIRHPSFCDHCASAAQAQPARPKQAGGASPSPHRKSRQRRALCKAAALIERPPTVTPQTWPGPPSAPLLAIL